jgi:hypothetical protein
MELIREGTKDKVTCGGCGSLWRFTPADIRVVHAPLNVGPHEIECMPEAEDHYSAYVTCPSCKRALPVPCSRELKRSLIDGQRRSEQDV